MFPELAGWVFLLFFNTVVFISFCVGLLQTPCKCFQCFLPNSLEIVPLIFSWPTSPGIFKCRVTSAVKEHKGCARMTAGRRGEQQTPVETGGGKGWNSFDSYFNLQGYLPHKQRIAWHGRRDNRTDNWKQSLAIHFFLGVLKQEIKITTFFFFTGDTVCKTLSIDHVLLFSWLVSIWKNEYQQQSSDTNLRINPSSYFGSDFLKGQSVSSCACALAFFLLPCT